MFLEPPCSRPVTSNVSWLPSSFPFSSCNVWPDGSLSVPVTSVPETRTVRVAVPVLSPLFNVAVHRPVAFVCATAANANNDASTVKAILDLAFVELHGF